MEQWRLTERIDTINIDNGHYCVADISKEYDNAKANAQLIATAPELLEACEDILHSVEHEGYSGRVVDSVENVKQAINKAKGE